MHVTNEALAALNGLTVAHFDIDDSNDEILITTTCGRQFRLWHEPDCCESVNIYDSIGDLYKLTGKRLTEVTETTTCDELPVGVSPKYIDESFTWTEITFKTTDETVVSRWIGTSNGYYSESVSFSELTNE